MASEFDDFEVFTKNLIPSEDGASGAPNDGDMPIVDPSEITGKEEKEEEEKETILEDPKEKEEKEEKEEEIVEKKEEEVKESEEEETEETEVEGEELQKENIEKEESIDDISEYEPEIVKFFHEKLYESLGWTIDENDEKINTIDGIVAHMEKLVEESSIPNFANKDIEDLNKYVEDGGSLKNYFDTRYFGGVDIESLDAGNSADQKLIIREYFKEQGISGDRVESRIERYEDSGVLKDESEDALEYLKNKRAKDSEKLLEQQENIRKETEKQQQKLYDDVTKHIRELKDVFGVPLNRQEKEDLIKGIFRVESDGTTKFQKEYNKSINNLVDSAAIVLMRDKILKRSRKKINSEATNNLKKRLQSSRANNRLDNSSGSIDNNDNNEKAFSSFNSITDLLV